MSAYENVIEGKLKLKGKALDVKAGGIIKKKKKKKNLSYKKNHYQDQSAAGFWFLPSFFLPFFFTLIFVGNYGILIDLVFFNSILSCRLCTMKVKLGGLSSNL